MFLCKRYTYVYGEYEQVEKTDEIVVIHKRLGEIDTNCPNPTSRYQLMTFLSQVEEEGVK